MAYYRTPSISFGPPLTPVVKKLIVFTSAVFILTYFPLQIFHWYAPFTWLSLQPELVVHRFYIWQLVTYLFLHGGYFHIIFNLFALWMFGADLERLWGPRRFLTFFFLTGIGAGLCDVLLNTIFHPGMPTATIGNSGAVFGVLLAYGLLFPDRPIFLYFIFPVKAKWFVLGMGVVEFVSSLSGPGSGVSHVAHLGGMLFAILYLRGGSFTYRWQLGYAEWRRARLRKRFESYMRDHEKKDDAGRWVN